MNLFLKFLITGLIMIWLTSCFKEDEMVQPHHSGNVITDTIELTQNYKYQVYFKLHSDSKVATNLRTGWDLAFECKQEGTHILLNSSCFMKVADCGIVPFAQPIDTTGLVWKFDRSDGNPDSTALLHWIRINGTDTIYPGHVYAIDRGLDENGNNLGLRQVIFDGIKQNRYSFRWANIDGTAATQAGIEKDTTVNFIHYSLKNGGEQSSPEPDKNGWDLLFSQYSTILFTDEGDPYPYLVTGVLLNQNGVSVALDSTNSFSDINFETARNLAYSRNLDAIGYDWKFYNFSTSSYTVLFNRTYIIRDTEGYFYKLRFTGFYNALGQKGYPVFEYQQL
jgi:hypothetical protein